MSTKRALLVGIDAYPHIRTLDGCVNDSRLVRSVLVERFGFPEANITQLLDAQATRDAMLAAFDVLAAATGLDDVVVIHFAGHGSQMRDREGDEPSGFDSTLMPWDTGREPHENRDITDDEVQLKLAALAAKTRHITVLVDACHSGTITRDAFGAKTRSVERDLRPVAELPASPIPGGSLPRARSGASGWFPLADKYVLIAGCRDEEESKEYFPPEGGTHGAVTYFLCQELRKATARTTYRDVFDVVSARVNAYNPVQHPQMEGTADKVVFGVDDVPPATFVTVTARVDSTIRLAAGSAHGVTIGSRYAVQSAGAKTNDPETALGQIVVRGLTAFTAEADITGEAVVGGITAGARAFETAHAFGDAALGVQLVGVEAETAFAAALGSSPVVAVAPAGANAAFRIYGLPARTSVAPGDPVPQAGTLAEPRWAVVDATGELLMPLKLRGDEKTVGQNLEKIARFRRILALDNPLVDSRLRKQVTVDVLRPGPRDTWIPATPDVDGGLAAVEEGTRVCFRVTNTGREKLFVAMVYLGTGSEVTVPRQIELPAGEFRELKGPVTFPPNYPFVDLGDPHRGVEGVETLKLFVTREFVDFKWLAHAAVRSVEVTAPAPSTPFASALQRAAGRGMDAEPETDGVPVAHEVDWATESRSFIVRRRATPLPAAGERVVIGHAVVTAPSIGGTIGTGIGADGTDETASFATDALRQALELADIGMKQTIAIEGAHHTPASRSASGPEPTAGQRKPPPEPIAVQLKPPPDGYGQMVLASDELGVVSWSFARPAPATRSADGRTAPRTYHLHSAVPEPAPAQPASRGVIGLVGKKVIKELVFPILKPMLGAAGASAVHWLETTRWPYRLRTFTPDDYTAADANPIDRDGWTRLSGGRALLMVHGTFSRSHLAFAALPQSTVADLHRLYDGRVFAFDHLFLSEDPAQNVGWLVSQLPDDADLTLDVVCHSRGGLVSRVLAERQGELSLGSRRVRIGKVVLVGVPNAGTALADPAHVETLLDVFTNLVNFVPDGTGAPVLSMIVEFAKLAAVGALDGLSGLRAMHPDGAFIQGLNAPAVVDDTRYFAVASNVTPVETGLVHFLRSRALTALLRGGNDLVVPSDGAFGANGASLFPVASPLLLEGETAVSHTKYFADARVRDQVLTWLASA